MGNPHNRHHQNIQRTAFLPMLCSTTSVMDTSVPKHARSTSSSSSSSSSPDDPLSPKVGCMGQVKRHSHNRVSVFPVTSTARNPYNNHNGSSYLKLKKLKSPGITTAISTVKRCYYRTAMDGFRDGEMINVADLDPPLPVIKKVQKQHDNCATEDLNLWRRRKLSGNINVELRCLKIQIINNQCLQQTSV